MKEQEIRPQKQLERYLELSAQDAIRCFSEGQRHDLPCVACGNERQIFQFKKSGFAYAKCDNCGTLYQTPRPSVEDFEQFYQDSESSRYWAEVFFPAVAEIRREKIFRPRMEMLATLFEQRGVTIKRLVDIGAGYGIFLDEWRKKFPDTEVVAVEPSVSLANECRAKNLRVVESIAEHVTELDGFADLVVCFEVLEHVNAPLSFVNSLKSMIRPGGHVFISTLSIDGFDLQMLWDQSPQISPPHHINFLSVEGFKELFQKAGLVDVEITTPGKLDVDIMRNASKRNPTLLKEHRFIKLILENDDSSQAFQTFLAENKLSSHAWVVGRKVVD